MPKALTDQFLMASIGSVFGEAMTLLLVLIAPMIVFALLIHWLEILIQRRLAERFGWKSVLWTGWLGTPIHELSHAAMCIVFRHKIHKIALFEPDREAGRLGYVHHSFHRGNWYEELGGAFIGIAPLIGGSLALVVLLWIFYPDAAVAAVQTAGENDQAGGSIREVISIMLSICGKILAPANLLTFRFWAFLYLVLCVGSHMAPSGSDYKGAARGVILLSIMVVGGILLLTFLQTDFQKLLSGIIGAMGPVFAVLGLTLMLCTVATIVVYGITSFIPRFYRVE